MSNLSPKPLPFANLGLSDAVMQAVTKVGYETPSPIQAATIPALLAGRDVLGQAQTGTGKTAAFALPLLTRTEVTKTKPQVLVLAPTRELAIQVAEAFQRYAAAISGFRVLPVYGGQSYGQQLTALKRGVHVVVGTPGRVIDHLERGTLDLSELKTLVLDEADEMLRMGFIEDVEEVLRKLPASRQVALFSATMPPQIRRIAQTYLQNPIEVTIATKTTTASNIRQRYWWVSGIHKLDALTRILEVETFDAMIIFVRTKAATEELAEKLQARGLTAAAINGDMQQAQRERTIHQLKDGKLDILVATDVAARGLDVERISHVLNYDIPYDVESYVHRIGRTGRAGRSGEAILFVTPREKGMLRQIERATKQPIETMQLPSVDAVNDTRVIKFFGRISHALVAGDEIDFYRKLLQRFESEHDVPAIEIAAALARLLQGDSPFLLSAPAPRAARERSEPSEHGKRASSFKHPDRPGQHNEHNKRPQRNTASRSAPEFGMESYRIEVGHIHGVKPANIVGAIANEAGLESRYIGRIDIREDHSTLDLPAEMPPDILEHLKRVWVSGQQLQMRRIDTTGTAAPAREFKQKSAGAGKFSPKPQHKKSGNPRPPYRS
ncbi:MAG TPA: DEAD/DEAH box helicase [Xylella sp.]